MSVGYGINRVLLESLGKGDPGRNIFSYYVPETGWQKHALIQIAISVGSSFLPQAIYLQMIRHVNDHHIGQAAQAEA